MSNHTASQTQSPYWNLPSGELMQSLDSHLSGLSDGQVQQRLAANGPNRLDTKEKASPLVLFFNQFKSPIVLILLFATLVSAFVNDWIDSLIILMIVLGSALLSFYQEYSAGNAADQLRARVQSKSRVVRDGQTTDIPSEALVPGDIILLSAGSLIPADGVVLEANDFFVNQAVLTGETFPVEKKPGTVLIDAGLAERTNIVFMGANVRSGSARVLVIETGRRTSFGQIANSLALRPPETEFERGIRRLGYLLTEVMFLLVIGIFTFNVLFHKPLLDSLLFSIALAVGLTPQLLPAIININLSKGAQAMATRGVIVRRLEAIENFGSMDVLCTDKTGTLTQGVVQLDGALGVDGSSSEAVLGYAALNAALQTGLTNPLDDAIIQKGVSGLQAFSKVDEIPYDFVRKRLSVVVADEQGEFRLISKGALDNILEVCNRVEIADQTQALDDDLLAKVHEKYANWSSEGYRVLGVATKTIPAQDECYSKTDEQGLVFAGFLLFLDPPKDGVQHAIQDLKKLGVNLKIITGDNQLVARHIGQVLGMGDFKVLSGGELNAMGDEALWHAVERTTIFAEVDPNQKERIILALKKRGHVVGYMGDGINDAPALHSADVGISVDNAVDVAKQAADLVLLKQDLDVLREGILQGRRTFANTLKYVFMATSANFGNMFSMAIASLFLPFLPLLPVQILLINFLTDLPEMTIASDNVDAVFVERPHRLNVNLVRRFMLVFGPLSSFFDLLTFGVLIWLVKANETSFQTGWFIESVISAGLVVFAVRTQLPFQSSHPSRMMLGMTALVAAATLVLPYSPLAGLLSFTPLPVHYLLIIFGIIVMYFVAAELTKRWFYRRHTADL